MDGYELAERLSRTPDAEGLPIIFLSGSHGEDQHVFRGYESGAVDYLLKPFDPGVLTSKVNVFLELARKRLELAEYGLRLERMVEERRGQGAFRSGGRGGADAEQLRHDLLAVLWPRHRGAEGTLTLVWHR